MLLRSSQDVGQKFDNSGTILSPLTTVARFCTETNPFKCGKHFLLTHLDAYVVISPLQANMDGKIVLITGASKRCGAAIAALYAAADVLALPSERVDRSRPLSKPFALQHRKLAGKNLNHRNSNWM